MKITFINVQVATAFGSMTESLEEMYREPEIGPEGGPGEADIADYDISFDEPAQAPR